jgi:hypothetical protein
MMARFFPTFANTTITATKTDALLVDLNNDNVANPGDTLRYTVTITNTGSVDATGLTFNDTPDANTTIVPGSVMTTPIAADDTYSALGNVRISISAGNGLLANDHDADGDALTISAPSSSANGGDVAVNPDGSFTYNPSPGFEGADSFTYTVSDNDGNTRSATVTINVSGMIWFIDNNVGAPGSSPGDGRLTNPFKSLAAFQAVNDGAGNHPAAGDNIFIYESATDYVGPVTLLSGQRLIGQDATASLSSITGLTPPSGSDPLPTTNSANATIARITSVTDGGINLGQNNHIQGLTVGDTTTSDITGTNFGTLTVLDTSLTGTGRALNLSTGTVGATFDKISSTNSPTTGISLTSIIGTLTVTGTTTIDNASGVGISIASLVAIPSGTSVSFGTTNINNRNNTGILINDADNTSGISFGATTIANAHNVGGYGVRVQNSSADVTFASTNISNAKQTVAETLDVAGFPTNDGDGDAIFLTGNSGSFNSNGGTITNSDGEGIDVRNSSNLNLTNVTIDLPGLASAASIGHGIRAINLSGTGTLTNTTITRFDSASGVNVTRDGFRIVNVNTDLTMTIAGGNFTNSPRGNDAFSAEAQGTSNMTLNVQNNGATPSLFTGLFGDAIDVRTVTGSTGTVNVNVSNSTFQNAAASGANGIQLTPFGGPATVNYNITGNTMVDIGRLGINAGLINMTVGGAVAPGPSLLGTISGNILENSTGRRGISIIADTSAQQLKANIDNNTLDRLPANRNGIVVSSRNSVPSSDVLITNNKMGQKAGFVGLVGGSAEAVLVETQGTAVTRTLIDGNTITSNATVEVVRVRAINTSSLSATVTNNSITDNAGTHLEFAATTQTPTAPGPVICLNMTGNTLPAAGVGVIRLNHAAGTAINVVQASAAALSAANSAATVTVVGTPTFGAAACSPAVAMLQSRPDNGAMLARNVERSPKTASALNLVSRIAQVNRQARGDQALALNHTPAKTGKVVKSSAARSRKSQQLNHAALARPVAAATTMVGSVNLNIGTLPAGKSVTITFDVVINPLLLPPNTTQVSNQGTVTGSNISPTVTDDPDTGAANDPTVTPVVIPNQPPTADAGPDQTVECAGGSTSVTLNGTGSTDPDAGDTLTYVWTEGVTPIATGANPTVNLSVGSHTITLTVTDSYGATDKDTVVINVVDTQAPVITLNGANPMTVECHTSFTDPGATAADACDSSVPVTASGSVDVNTPGTYTITYTATDDSANKTTATRTVNVVDTTAPVITVNGANPMTVECHTSFSDPGATASDSCAGSVPVTTSGTVNVDAPGTYTITYTATDGTNTATSTRTVKVVDTTAPVITVNGANPMTVECHAGFSDPGATANDSCAGSVPVTTSGSVDPNTPGTYTLTYTASDGTNTATATRTVKVVDTTAPVISLNGASPMTVECHTSFSDPGAVASDACDSTVPVTASGSVDPNTVGTYTITYTATDDSGNAATPVTRTVNVVDTTPPSITINGANPMTVECHTSFTDPGVSATDSCEGVIPIITSGSVNPDVPGTYIITYSATDSSGNTSSVTRTVNVVDTIAPTLALNGANPMTIECHTTFTDPGATATDSCAGNLTGSIVVTGSVNPNVPGTYTLTYTVSDGFNQTSKTRTVKVVDTIAPTLTLNGANPMTVECHTTFTDPGATATDSCAGDLTGSITTMSNVNPNMVGTYTITYTVSDGYNQTSKTRTVIVVDTGAPTITLTGQTVTLWPPDHQYVTVNLTSLVASVSDGCDSTTDINDVVISKVTSDEAENGNGDGNTSNDIVIAANCKSVQLRSERAGNSNGRVYTIVFSVTDANGNVATASAKVIVPKDGPGGSAIDDGPKYTVTSNCP